MTINAFGILIPVSFAIDEIIAERIWPVDKSGSVGLGIIMVATCGGISAAFVVRRRAEFIIYRSLVCKRTKEHAYEDDECERLFCPSHGEQEHGWGRYDHFDDESGKSVVN